jgi:hypothetical protein
MTTMSTITRRCHYFFFLATVRISGLVLPMILLSLYTPVRMVWLCRLPPGRPSPIWRRL